MTAVAEQVRGPFESADARVGVSNLTYNRLDEGSRTIERMLSLPERPRMVVVDNGSTDGTPVALGQRFPSVRCLALSGNSGASGRNAGVAALDTPYVALCDDWWCGGLRFLRSAASRSASSSAAKRSSLLWTCWLPVGSSATSTTLSFTSTHPRRAAIRPVGNG